MLKYVWVNKLIIINQMLTLTSRILKKKDCSSDTKLITEAETLWNDRLSSDIINGQDNDMKANNEQCDNISNQNINWWNWIVIPSIVTPQKN